MRHELWHETHHDRRFEDAGAERIGEHDAAFAQRVDEARHAEAGLGVELERIGEIAVDAAPDHVRPLQPGNGAHVDFAIAHRKVAAFDEQKAEIAGEIGLLEIGFVERTRRQQADARIRSLRHRHEAQTESLEERREPLDIHVAVKRRKSARQDQAIGQRIAGARWRLGAIAENPPAPVRAPADVGSVNMQEFIARRLHADQGMQKVGAAGDRGRRQIARSDQLALAINIGEDPLHQLHALLDPLCDLTPFAGVYEQRHMGQRPGPFARVAVDAVGDAGVANVPVRRRKASAYVICAKVRQQVEIAQPMRAREAIRADEFIGNAGERLVIGDERGQTLRRGQVLLHRGRSGVAHHFYCFGRKDFMIAASVST